MTPPRSEQRPDGARLAPTPIAPVGAAAGRGAAGEGSSVGPASLRLLLAAPHRMFFFLGLTQLLCASAWWALVLIGRQIAVAAPAVTLAPTLVHAASMAGSFLPLFMFGFVFTAGPRWLLVDPLPARAWIAPAIACGVALTLFWPAQAVDATAARAALAVHAGAWIYCCGRFLLLIRASRAPDKLHASVIAAALFAGGLLMVAVAVGGAASYGLVRPIGIWGFLLPVFVTVCHRMIPFFTASSLPGFRPYRPTHLLVAMLAPAPVHLVLELAGMSRWTWVVDLPMGAAMLILVFRWGLVASIRVRLLAMLHLGFAWYGIALTAYGIQSLAEHSGRYILGLAPLHMLTIGFFSTIAVAMVTRVTLGHSGRPLVASRLDWALYALLHGVALLRVAAELAGSPALMAASGGAWLAVTGVWALRLLPIYLAPRVDGRPG